MQRYLPIVYLSAVWLTSHYTVPFAYFDGIPVYVFLSPVMFFFLPIEFFVCAATICVFLIFYEALKILQPEFAFTAKGFLGILAFSCIMTTIYFSLISVRNYSSEKIGKWLRAVLFVILISVVIQNIFGAFGLTESRYESYFFPMHIYAGLFSEPSHLALGLSPFIFMLIYDFSQFRRYLGISSVYALVITMMLCPSATLISISILAGVIAIGASVLRGRVIAGTFALFLSIVFAFLIFAVPEISDRAVGIVSANQFDPFWEQNISALAFLKGRQMAEYAIGHFPLGVSFLGMAVLAPHSSVSYLADFLFDLNSRDGSSLLFKGICELGILFIAFAIASALRFIRRTIGTEQKSFYDLVILCFEFTFFMHFIRAASYYTGVVAIGISACIFGLLFSFQKKHQSRSRKLLNPIKPV